MYYVLKKERERRLIDEFRRPAKDRTAVSRVICAALFIRQRQWSRYDLSLIKLITGSEPDLALRIKCRGGAGKAEAETALEEHGFDKPATIKLMLLRESGCDAVYPYVKK